MRRWIALILSSSFFCISTLAQELPVPEVEILPNGLEVAWFVNDKLPLVDIAYVAKSGHRDDPAGKSGTSELLGAVLDRGAGGLSAHQLARAIEMLGASRYISVDDETFSVGIHGLAIDASVLLELFGKLVMNPEFPADEVKREHARILDRWNHVADYAETLGTLAFQRILTMGTPYGRGSFLSAKEFAKVSRADVLTYYRQHFIPKNSVLMVVGRVNKKEFRGKLLSGFGNWRNDQAEAPARVARKYTDTRLPSGRNQIVLIDRPNLTQANVKIGFRGPLITSPDHHALAVTNALLGEYFNSRLNSLIRDKLSLTYSIGSGFTYSKELGIFSVSSTTRNESVGQLIKKTIEVLKGLKKGPIFPEEIETSKEYLEGGFPLSTATLSSVASRWLGVHLMGLNPGYLNEFVPKVKAINQAEIREAVLRTFDLENLVVTVAGDAKRIEKSLAGLKLGHVKRVSAKDLM